MSDRKEQQMSSLISTITQKLRRDTKFKIHGSVVLSQCQRPNSELQCYFRNVSFCL